MTTVAGLGRRTHLVPVLLATVVLGLIGMHTLTRHLEMPTHAPVAMTMTAATDTGISAPRQGESATEPGGDQPMGDMVMLCTAMLLGAAAGLLLALRLSRLATHRAWQPIRGSTPPRLLTSRAGAGPPYLSAFSVVRC